MWQTTSTPAAISPAATKPQSCDSSRMPRTYACIPGPSPDERGLLFHRQRLVDQLLAVRNFLGELGVRAFLRDLQPQVVFLRRKRHHLDVVVLEHLDHLVVEPFRLGS